MDEAPLEPQPPAGVPAGASSSPVRWGLGDFAWIYVAGIVAGAILGSIGVAITGDTADHTGALTTALSALGQFGGWFGFCALVARTKGRSLREDFGLRIDAGDFWALFVGLGLFFAGSLLILPLVNIANESQQVVHDLETASGAKLAVFVSLAGVVAPVCEELLFRGLLLRALRRRMSPTYAVAVQALAFALAHPLLSPTLGDLAVVPALVMLGLVSGAVATRRGNLSASIFMHIGFNLVTTLAAL